MLEMLRGDNPEEWVNQLHDWCNLVSLASARSSARDETRHTSSARSGGAAARARCLVLIAVLAGAIRPARGERPREPLPEPSAESRLIDYDAHATLFSCASSARHKSLRKALTGLRGGVQGGIG